MKALKVQDAQLKEQISAIEAEVKNKRGIQQMIAGTYTVRCSEVCKQQLDTASFKEKYSSLYSQFAKVITYKRLTIN